MNIRKKIYAIFKENRDNTVFADIYNGIMLIVIVISIIPLCFKVQTPLLIMIDRITVSIFIVEYMARWITYDLKRPELKYMAFFQYPLSFFAIIDLLSILPSITLLNKALRLFKLLRLFKTLRVLRMLRYSKSFKVIANVLKKEKMALTSVCYMAIGYIFISALVMFSVEPSSFNTLFDAVYWATTALTTVGYGDIYPVTTIGKVVSMVSSVLGIAFVALPSGIITAGYLKELNAEKDT